MSTKQKHHIKQVDHLHRIPFVDDDSRDSQGHETPLWEAGPISLGIRRWEYLEDHPK